MKAEDDQRGWRADVCPVEVSCRGFIAASDLQPSQHHTMRETSQTAEHYSHRLGAKGHTPRWDQPVVGLTQNRVYSKVKDKTPNDAGITTEDADTSLLLARATLGQFCAKDPFICLGLLTDMF